MQTGAIIERGPRDWQILQQKNGRADIDLSGRWTSTGEISGPEVWVRVVREETGDSLIAWRQARLEEEGKWSIKIEAVPAGGLYRIETCLIINGNHPENSLRGDMILHLGVGDVYVIAGQSNSAGCGRDPVYDPPEIGVHLLRNNGSWDLAAHPMNESTATVHELTREYSNPGHSPYLSFAKYLKRQLGYPVGLIQASLGGSPLSMWNPEENGSLYRNMLDIIKLQESGVKGILWYQGCSDTGEGECSTYLERFKRMVAQLREDLKEECLPVLTVQLNRFVPPASEIQNLGWAKIREAQRQAAKQIPGVFVIPSTDSNLSDGIHNSAAANMILGERLARVALKHLYGFPVYSDAPDLAEAKKTGSNQLMLSFHHVQEHLTCYDTVIVDLPFTVEDEAGKAALNSYVFKKNTLVLTTDRELVGKCVVHGAWEQNPKYLIPVDFATHLPMLSFYGVEVTDKKE